VSVQLPLQDNWIPNKDQLFTSKAAIMECVGGVLDGFGRSEAYTRRVLHHGLTGQVKNGVGNIIVTLLGVYPGKAGGQQFQFAEGAYGKIAQRFARYRVLIATPWKSIEGGTVASLPTPEESAEQSAQIDRDGWLVYSGLLALALGGLTTDPPYAPIPEDNVLPATMLPYGPEGQMAGWEYQVELQL
jgi:hypothetical protein